MYNIVCKILKMNYILEMKCTVCVLYGDVVV